MRLRGCNYPLHLFRGRSVRSWNDSKFRSSDHNTGSTVSSPPPLLPPSRRLAHTSDYRGRAGGLCHSHLPLSHLDSIRIESNLLNSKPSVSPEVRFQDSHFSDESPPDAIRSDRGDDLLSVFPRCISPKSPEHELSSLHPGQVRLRFRDSKLPTHPAAGQCFGEFRVESPAEPSSFVLPSGRTSQGPNIEEAES